MSSAAQFSWDEMVLLDDLVSSGEVKLGRGNIISKIDIRNNPGTYPIYSSSSKNQGKMGEYGSFMFDEELISWSVDGGGYVFYRPKHKFSVTNVSGYMRLTGEWDYKFVAYVLQFQHEYFSFDYQTKAHPSVIREFYLFPRIPLPEQQKIAAILSSVDDVIEKTRAQIDKLKDLKTGMMQELLTKGIGHTAFKGSPMGRIPEGWPHFELRDLTLVITKGTTPTTGGDSYTDSGINFIKVECINKSGFVDSKKFSFIDSETHRKLSRSILHEGDILITIAGATVGKLAIVKKEHLPANTNQALAIVRVDESKVLRDFVYYWLQSGYIKSSIDGVQTVGAQPNLSLSQIGDFNIFLPGIEEQKAIVSSLSSLDLLIAGAQRKMSAVEYLKKSLMQDLLTGKVRVNVDNKENAVA
ncbi:restriction endonuclease subunit S [Alcanivorax sp.]|uniref:restriction endonuclease subunit S n=1 Tax=Alcanivorax sp. TaxID=1872427 RepID=UPI00260D5D07|nr:restriction endonuclease subunit S [Alcanivorax sp.]